MITMAKRKQNKKDGRSNPRLNPCPPEQQRYILRECTKDGLPLLGESQEEGKRPSRKELETYLKRGGYDSGTFVLLSTRPRPKLVATYQFQWKKNNFGRMKRKLLLIK